MGEPLVVLLRGSALVIVAANADWLALVKDRDTIGLPIAWAFPEKEARPAIRLARKVYRTQRPVSAVLPSRLGLGIGRLTGWPAMVDRHRAVLLHWRPAEPESLPAPEPSAEAPRTSGGAGSSDQTGRRRALR